MVIHESMLSPTERNHGTLRQALRGTAIETGMGALERALDKDPARAWRDVGDAPRCGTRRYNLLAQAAATQLTSRAEAAAALRIVLKAPGNPDDWDDPAVVSGEMTEAEELHCANIIRSVHRYLAAEA